MAVERGTVKNRVVVPTVIIYNKDGQGIELGNFVTDMLMAERIQNKVDTCTIIFAPTLLKDNPHNAINGITPSVIRSFLQKQSGVAIKFDSKSPRWKFLGFISDIGESTVFDGGTPHRTLYINCDLMLGKMLIKDNVVNASLVADLPEFRKDKQLLERAKMYKWLRGSDEKGGNVFFGGDPKKAIRWIFNKTVAVEAPEAISIDVDTTDITAYGLRTLKLQTKALMGGEGGFDFEEEDYEGNKIFDFHFLKDEMVLDPRLTAYNGSLLDYLLACIDVDWYEVFLGTTTRANGMPANTLTIRPKPYTRKGMLKEGDDENWTILEDLKSGYKITDSDILEMNISQNDFEFKTYFISYYDKSLIAHRDSMMTKLGLLSPIINIKGIKKYGLRKIEATSTVVNFSKLEKKMREKEKKERKNIKYTELEEGRKVIDLLTEKRERIKQWYGFPHYQNGEIVVNGADNYRKGMKLFHQDGYYWDEEEGKYKQGVMYYVYGVEHKYSAGSGYISKLKVIRGVPEEFEADGQVAKSYVAKWFDKHSKDFISMKIGEAGEGNTPKTKNTEKEIKKTNEDASMKDFYVDLRKQCTIGANDN